MKTFFSTFLAVLLASALSLFIYDRFVLQPRLHATGDPARQSFDAAREEAEGLVRDVGESVSRSVAEARAELEVQRAEDDLRRELRAREMAAGRQRAEAAEAMQRANLFKVSVAEHYMSTGSWPESPAATGLGEPENHAGGPVASIEIEPEGVIAIHLKPEVAQGGVIRLIPEASGYGVIEWRCRASGYPAALTLSNCEG